MLDVVDGGRKISLRSGNDPVAHLLWDETVVVPDDADDGNVDVRENVGWGANDREPSQDQDEDRHHYECVGPP